MVDFKHTDSTPPVSIDENFFSKKQLWDKVGELRKEIELLEKSNDFYAYRFVEECYESDEYEGMMSCHEDTGKLARSIKAKLKETREAR